MRRNVEPVLSIGKLARSQERYYLAAVADGQEDYYLRSGEAPGVWCGRGTPGLGLRGTVSAEDLTAVLEGAHPRSGGALSARQRAAERVPGFDLTLSAPKSVSLLFALGEPEVREAVMAAHDGAVRAALGYLEREAAFGRRRRDGEIVPIASGGLVAAAFRHRTSRAGDPALHTHVLVANLVLGEDGRWGAIDAARIYAHAQTAGYLYKAELRARLTRSLGLEWTHVVRGSAEVAGIPESAIRAFSRRREEIERALAARGEHGPRAAQVAAHDTRQAKDYRVSAEALRKEWRVRAGALGLGREQVARLMGPVREPTPPDLTSADALERLLGAEGLTREQSAFGRRNVLRALCGAARDGAGVDQIEALADRVLASNRVIALGAPADQLSRRGHAFTTQEMLNVERQLIEGACARRGVEQARASVAAVERALAGHPELTPEQVQMVHHVALAPDGVAVVVGRAGAGKTRALVAAREALEASGANVIGCSTSARAAKVLVEEAGVASTTLARLLSTLRRGDHGPLDAASVVIVDEAGMVGTRPLAELLSRAADAGARVVLVGDPAQLPEIEAGGAFRALADRLGAIELTGNRRQREAWERLALVHLRKGRATEALALYRERGRVHLALSPGDARAQVLDDWWERRADGETLMLAARRRDVDALNAQARERRRAAGELQGDDVVVGGRPFAIGDRVVATRNRRVLGVVNGTRGVVTAVGGADGLRLRTDEGDEVLLPREYAAAGYLDHAYAMTVHKAQGTTTECALVLADEAAFREWAYVALSRGRTENRLYMSPPEGDDEVGRPIWPEGNAQAAIARALSRSRAKGLALDPNP